MNIMQLINKYCITYIICTIYTLLQIYIKKNIQNNIFRQNNTNIAFMLQKPKNINKKR